MDKKFMTERISDLKKIIHYLEKEDDTIKILRIHLLIEELLEEYIRSRLKNPDAIDWSRLSFYHKVGIAEAFYEKNNMESLWLAIKTINQIRNDLAHHLKPIDIQRKLDKINQLVKINFPDMHLELLKNQHAEEIRTLALIYMLLCYTIKPFLSKISWTADFKVIKKTY